jgi:hypothetical protein
MRSSYSDEVKRCVQAIALLATVAGVASCGDSLSTQAPAAAGPQDPAELDGMLLHLPDGPVGARIGDDSGCGQGVSSEGGDDPYTQLATEAGQAVIHCLNQLEPRDVFADSLVVSFPTAALASRAMTPDTFGAILRYHGLDCCNGEPVGPFKGVSDPGADTLEASSPTDSVALIGWRSGNTVGAVSVQHIDGAAGALDEARRLAAVQDERMRSPVAVPDIDDDRSVGLDATPFQAWWLGETFAPAGFPASELRLTRYGDGLLELDYDRIRIEIFEIAALPAGSVSEQILGVAGELFDSPCTVVEPIAIEFGRALLLGRFVPDEFFGTPSTGHTGWDELSGPDCPDGEPNVWMATIELDPDLLIRINAPLCYNCLNPPDPELPYQTPEGLQAVIGGLRQYDG